MKKRMLWVCGVLAVCFVLLAVLAVSHLNRNPNVGVSLTDPDGGAVLPESLVQADLKVHTGNVAELPDGCAAFVIEAADITLAEPIVQAAEDVPVIFVNRKPEMENACYIGGDAYQAGATQGALLLAQVLCIGISRNNTAIHDKLAGTVTIDLPSQKIFDSPEALIEYTKRIAAERAQRENY